MHLRELRRLPAQPKVFADERIGLGLAREDAEAHLVAAMERVERLAVGRQEVHLRRPAADLGDDPVDDGDARAERVAHVGRGRDRVGEASAVVEEREEHVEEDLGVGLAADRRAEKLRHAGSEPLPDRVERRERARLREEPLAITEGVRVLGAKRAHGRVSNVGDEEIGAHIARPLRHVDLRTVVDWTAAHEHLAALIEPDAPTELACASLDGERVRLRRQHTAGEVSAITDQPEQTCHAFSSTRSVVILGAPRSVDNASTLRTGVTFERRRESFCRKWRDRSKAERERPNRHVLEACHILSSRALLHPECACSLAPQPLGLARSARWTMNGTTCSRPSKPMR